MIRPTIIALLLCALCAGISAQQVSVPGVEAMPGETVAFTLNLTGGKADTYTAMQFDVQFPASGFATTGKYSVSELWPNVLANIGNVDDKGVATIPVASSETIGAANVEGLLSVSFTVGSEVSIGDYNVTLTNLWLGYGTSSKDYLDDVTFTVHVVAAHTIVLDETSTVLPEPAEGVNVKVKRTIKANEWSSICLPFAMSEQQVKEAFGNDVELADFKGTDSEFDDNDRVVGISVNFDEATAIEANHPYIIKVKEPVTQFTVEHVDIEAVEDEACIEFDNGRTGTRRVVYSGFYGTYHAETVLDEYTLFLNGNKFWYSTGQTHMKAFRAYFAFLDILTDVEDGNYGARIVMHFGDSSEASGVQRIAAGQQPAQQLYDLQGRQVMRPLKGRIYIDEGKKMVVK